MDNYGKGDRIPREDLHNQDHRLTNKHVKTLAFLQELAKENKELKQRVEELENERGKCKEIHALAEDSQNRIKEIQEKYLARADEINQMLSEQHRNEMMQVLDEKMETERSLKEEILKLRHEIESLQRTNVELREESHEDAEKQKMRDRNTELELLVEGLQIEMKDLTAEKDKLHTSLEEAKEQASQMHQLQELRTLNQNLTDELREVNQKNLEYVYKIEKLEQEVKDNSTEKDQTVLVEAMKNKMEKLMKEKELALMREDDARHDCEETRALNEEMEKRLRLLAEEQTKLIQEQGALYIEYGKLSKRLRQDEDKAAFREFVALKRELIATKNENEILRLKVRTSSNTLPMLKEDLPPPAAKPLTKKGKKKLLAITLAHGTGTAAQ
ncbi:trichohyalin-like [Littorina saxatilis]|uniref:Uncharacterized protein n=1 Tax=Littorina saxatilis TaxID=31220 RepID=A0AAN9BYT9_9CAEN